MACRPIACAPFTFGDKGGDIDLCGKREIQWREDASNASDDYLRNQLRHHLLPQWKAITPTIQEQLGKSIEKLAWAEAALDEQVKQFRVHHFESFDNHQRISLATA